jgi:hypothetical protein
VALVGAVLDLATDALPILLKGVVALDDVLQSEAPRSVADLLAPQKIDAPVHVLARHGRLDLFEAEKVLLVERAQALESNLELVDLQFVLFRLHVSRREDESPDYRSKRGFPSR